MELLCPHCHRPLGVTRIGFRESCSACGTELHACIYCLNYAPGKANDCNEPQAEPVRDKTRNNRCEWFRFSGTSPAPPPLGKKEAEELLKKLWGKNTPDTKP